MFPRCSRGNSRLRASWLLPEESALGEKLHLGASSPDLLLQGCSGQAGWLHWNIQARLEQPSWLLHGPQKQQRYPSPHQLCPYTSFHPHLPLSTAGTASFKLQRHPLLCAGWGGPSELLSGGTATSTHGSLAEPPARPRFTVGGSSAD